MFHDLLYNAIFFNKFDSVLNRRNLTYTHNTTNMLNILYDDGYFTNSRNMKLYFQKYYPKKLKPIAKIIYLHGYASNNSYWSHNFCTKLAEQGFCIYTLDYEGHGKSDGLWVYIKDFSLVEKDVADFLKKFIHIEYPLLKTFLIGDSMGGAVAINVSRKNKKISSGCILIAPMIKIADEAKPSQFLHNFLINLCKYIPTFPILPNSTTPESGFHPLVSRSIIYTNPLIYNQKPRLKTALELYNVSCSIEQNLDKINFPFFVIHGKQDKLTNCEHSNLLYNLSNSEDKMIKIYEEGFHCLLDGPFEALILDDILKWLKKRI